MRNIINGKMLKHKILQFLKLSFITKNVLLGYRKNKSNLYQTNKQIYKLEELRKCFVRHKSDKFNLIFN